MENAFYFMFLFQSSFRSWGIYIFILTLSYVGKLLIRKLMLISKFMASETGQQIIAINILPNIWRRKDNQAMKFG